MGAHPLYGALNQRGLFDQLKPAYNQSWPDGQLKLTASAFNQLWISMPAVLVTVPTVTQNSLHPLSTSSITACHLLNVAWKDNKGRRNDNPSGRHPIRTIGAPTSIISPFYTECPFCHNPFNLSWLWIGLQCFDAVGWAAGRASGL